MKEDAPGSEWAAVVVMILVFIVGFVLGGMAVYITLKTIRAPIIVAAPPPAEPAVEDWVVKGKGK